MVPLHNVQYRHDVAAVKQLLDYMATNEAAAANDEVNVFFGGHGRLSNHTIKFGTVIPTRPRDLPPLAFCGGPSTHRHGSATTALR